MIERCVVVQRQPDGFGLTVTSEFPVYVHTLKPDGAAFCAGVRQGDRIVKVSASRLPSSLRSSTELPFSQIQSSPQHPLFRSMGCQCRPIIIRKCFKWYQVNLNFLVYCFSHQSTFRRAECGIDVVGQASGTVVVDSVSERAVWTENTYRWSCINWGNNNMDSLRVWFQKSNFLQASSKSWRQRRNEILGQMVDEERRNVEVSDFGFFGFSRITSLSLLPIFHLYPQKPLSGLFQWQKPSSRYQEHCECKSSKNLLRTRQIVPKRWFWRPQSNSENILVSV